jgi:hypothetical protein
MDPVQSGEPDVGDPVAAQPTGRDERAARAGGGRDPMPSADPTGRPRGRHEAPRRLVLPGGLAVAAAVVAAVILAGVLATRLMSSAEQAPERPAATTIAAPTAAPAAAPTSRRPGTAAFGNLVDNWSFEQDLNGWQVLGAAEAVREPQGRTSGSCALVRASGPQPGRVGLRLPGVVEDAPAAGRYVASAWVRSTAPGLQVTVQLAGAGGTGAVSRSTTTTLPGLRWRRVFVAHTVAAAGTGLNLEVTADGVAAGDALLVDEVIVRQG